MKAETTRKAFYLWHRIDSGAFIFNSINRLPLRTTYLLATLALAVIGLADYATHLELMIAPFYAIPCFLVDWRIGRMPALVYGIFASIVQWYIGTFGGHPYSRDFYLYWDILLNLLFYGVLIWIVAKLRLALEMEQALSRMDFLTRLANRKTFVDALDTQVRKAGAGEVTSALSPELGILSVQLDRFASFNQQQGYTVGDLALGAVADVMRRSAREDELTGRTDNAEFSIVRWGASEKELEAAMHSLARQMDMLMLMRGWQLTFSIAAARFETTPESAPAAMGKLRVLLDEARMSGKNRSICRTWDASGHMTGARPQNAALSMDFEKTGQMFVETGQHP